MPIAEPGEGFAQRLYTEPCCQRVDWIIGENPVEPLQKVELLRRVWPRPVIKGCCALRFSISACARERQPRFFARPFADETDVRISCRRIHNLPAALAAKVALALAARSLARSRPSGASSSGLPTIPRACGRPRNARST